jgi:hypothetical protein
VTYQDPRRATATDVPAVERLVAAPSRGTSSGSGGRPPGRRIRRGAADPRRGRARELGLLAVRLYTNAVMTENLTFYPRHG